MRDEAAATSGRCCSPPRAPSRCCGRPCRSPTWSRPPESTYYAPATPGLVAPAATYTTPVTVSNPTLTTWTADRLGAVLPLGASRTATRGQPTATNQVGHAAAAGHLRRARPSTSPRRSRRRRRRPTATSAPTTCSGGSCATRSTGQWLSATSGIAPLQQRAAVEEPTSDQLGLEKFYAYAGQEHRRRRHR